MTVSNSLHPSISVELQLSNSESLRLFCEGVRALDSYDQSASKESLKLAIERLDECVLRYPQDLLPRFYLGVAKSLTSYSGLADALQHFQVVGSSNIDALRLPTKYNRATTLIAHYNASRFKEAENLLSELFSEAQQIAAHDRDSIKPLLYRSWAKLTFVRIRQLLWVRRHELLPENDHDTAKQCRAELDRFADDLRLADSFEGVDDVWAFHWNNEGLYHESMAHLQKNSSEEACRDSAQESAELYENSLRRKAGWPNALANLARVYYDLLGRQSEAIAIWERLTHGIEQVQYSHYSLGKAFLSRGQEQLALEHFRLAPDIPEAVANVTRLTDGTN